MRVTVTAKGPTLDSLTRDAARDLKAGNRAAARAIAKTGTAAMKRGAPRFYGKVGGVRTEVDSWPDRARVLFDPSPAGMWAIAEAGRRGGYPIKPRRARALRMPGGFAASAVGGPVGGRKAWTQAGERLAKVLDRTVTEVFDDAIGI